MTPADPSSRAGVTMSDYIDRYSGVETAWLAIPPTPGAKKRNHGLAKSMTERATALADHVDTLPALLRAATPQGLVRP